MRRLNLRQILCPIDFSPLASGALKTASTMARARNAELRALHVVPSEGVEPPAGIGSLERQVLMSRLRTTLAEEADSYDLVGAAIREGDPGTQILRFASEMPADLIVMGAPGVDRPERPMGPVASVVVARADCPVLTVPLNHTPRSREPGLFGRIVCGVDLAPSSRSVIQQALSLAWEAAGHLTYVCVVPDADPNAFAASRDRLLEAIPAEAGTWCEIEVFVVSGTASTEIVRIAEQQEADLLVLGAPRRWTSTTHAVLSRSLCPVLVTHDVWPLPWPAVLPADTGSIRRPSDSA